MTVCISFHMYKINAISIPFAVHRILKMINILDTLTGLLNQKNRINLYNNIYSLVVKRFLIVLNKL